MDATLELCDLPPEVIIEILKNLGLFDVAAFGITCKLACALHEIVPPSKGDNRKYKAVLLAPRFQYVSNCGVLSTGEIIVMDHSGNSIWIITGDKKRCIVEKKNSGYHDGSIKQAVVSLPTCCAITPEDCIIFSDRNHHTIRKISSNLKNIETIVGKPKKSGMLSEGKLAIPSGVCLDKEGNLFICDERNHSIVKRSPEGKVSLVVEAKKAKDWPRRVVCDTKTNCVYFVCDSRIYKSEKGNLEFIYNHSHGIYGFVMDRHGDLYFGGQNGDNTNIGVYKMCLKLPERPVFQLEIDPVINVVTGMCYWKSTLYICSRKQLFTLRL